MFLVTLKENSIYSFDFLSQICFPILIIVFRVSIWRALYSSTSISQNVSIQSMILYCTVSQALFAFIQSDVMTEINRQIIIGDIATKILLPLSLRTQHLIRSLSANIIKLVVKGLTPMAIAFAIYGVDISLSGYQLVLFLISCVGGFLIYFLYSFIMGISAIWFKNAFFISNIHEAMFNLFSGLFVPLFYFGKVLTAISDILPFQYMIYRPITIISGMTSTKASWDIVLKQGLWIAGLYLIGSILWNRGQKHIFVNGG